MASVLFWAVLHCIAFAAGGPIGTTVVIAVWVVVSYLPGKKAAAQLEAQHFDDLDAGDLGDIHASSQVDFAAMTMTTRVSSPGDDTRVEVQELRRSAGGDWSCRWEAKSASEEIRRLRALAARLGGPIAESTEARVAEVQRNAWQPLDGHDASKVEVAYQRYLKTL